MGDGASVQTRTPILLTHGGNAASANTSQPVLLGKGTAVLSRPTNTCNLPILLRDRVSVKATQPILLRHGAGLMLGANIPYCWEMDLLHCPDQPTHATSHPAGKCGSFYQYKSTCPPGKRNCCTVKTNQHMQSAHPTERQSFCQSNPTHSAETWGGTNT